MRVTSFNFPFSFFQDEGRGRRFERSLMIVFEQMQEGGITQIFNFVIASFPITKRKYLC